jgi:hypothetical protein
VGWIFVTIVASLGLAFVWGLVAPRSRWRTMTAWSVSDPYAHEPGAFGYGLRRLASAVGIIGLATVGSVAAVSYADRLPSPSEPQTPVQAMWGEPAPRVINRVIRGTTVAPSGLVAVPVLGYQAFGALGPPAYLARLGTYTRFGSAAVPGLIGTAAPAELRATATANLVLHVRVPVLCVPRAVVVIESEATIKIGVYYGLPDSAAVSLADNEAGCEPGSLVTASLLIPIELASAVGDRTVESLEGAALPAVRLITATR